MYPARAIGPPKPNVPSRKKYSRNSPRPQASALLSTSPAGPTSASARAACLSGSAMRPSSGHSFGRYTRIVGPSWPF
jgi:hypothetical protein